MILLDTDHISVLQDPKSPRRDALIARMVVAVDETFGVTIVSFEEQMRGWLATLAKERKVSRHVSPYRHLRELVEFYQAFPISDFSDAAAAKWMELRASKTRNATMDLKIASIALVDNRLLLTANRGDFEQVPGLRFENWLD
jgi:tRNA(fMet)-specific endonuclease VapC